MVDKAAGGTKGAKDRSGTRPRAAARDSREGQSIAASARAASGL
jgi:hypothetical protein